MEEGQERETTETPQLQGLPHEGLFLILAYLPLYELLVMSQVCRSLKVALENDILPWLNIVVGKPLNKRFTDDHLLQVSSKANGRLRTLVLQNCTKITDNGLIKVAAQNSHISTLHVPACTTLTPGGVIKAIELLTTNNHRLKSLSINGIYNIKRDELEILHELVGEKRIQQNMQGQNLYHHFKKIATIRHKETSCVIDVDICSKCSEVQAVFDCPRVSCKRMVEKQQQADCRGCSHCILRCEECGVCIKDDEQGDAACADTLCLDCWLQLPKCNFCNKPYCNQHADQQCSLLGSSGFLCTTCHAEFVQNL